MAKPAQALLSFIGAVPALRGGAALMARSPLRAVLARVARLPVPAPMQQFAQQFARGALRRVLRDFPLLGELLELSRVLFENAGATAASAVAEGFVATAPVTPASAAVAPARPAPAAVAAARAMPPEELELLLADLRGPSAEVALAAVEALAGNGDPGAHDALLAVLRNANGYFHPLPRVAALHALAGDPSESVRAAIVAAVGGVSAEVSLAAIAALTQHAPAQAIAPLQRVLADRTGYFAPEVRTAAERALGRLLPAAPRPANGR